MKSRQGLEEMVKQLQKELQDRDNVISQMHEQMSVASFRTSPLQSPFVMSPGKLFHVISHDFTRFHVISRIFK